jgi:NAD(P)-dependent dehydrogenase (short-subunit alcohol dehydrogenase family)
MPDDMSITVVTGANKGIGLALAAELKQRGHTVLAVCRKSSPELSKLGVEVVDGVDVATDAGVAKLVAAVGSRAIKWLVNNAGIMVWGDRLGELNVDGIRQQFEVNALAPLRITDALRARLDKGAKVALVTSRMGSIDDNTSGGAYGYRMSKAALNMAGKSLSVDLKPSGVAVIILHPGMVKTDMVGGHGGQVEPDDAAKKLCDRIDALTLDTTGSFHHANGEKLPW